ncbi:MAG TPA: hypothetical protein VM425_02075 [Myxococcota bacterium]|nr:hypothetical protein [Myxococcota bacterium]
MLTDYGKKACVCLPGWSGPDCEQQLSDEVDVLFVLDNSGSMVAAQSRLGQSFDAFASELENLSVVDYHMAVITTGVQSPGCQPCEGVIQSSCMNETGENGRFQDRIGYNQGSIDDPDYIFTTDPQCGRVVTAATKSCFYDTSQSRGFAVMGINGCVYERGLESVKIALGDLADGYNGGFLRDNARLVVVIFSDEEDCGNVGDVTEEMPGIGGNACYFAAKGIDADGNFGDSTGKPYRLTPVEDHYKFLMGLKNNMVKRVKFAAIVGVKDVNTPETTTIEYAWNDSDNIWDIDPACITAGCGGNFCSAKPGTRYIKMAQLFGIGSNGFVDTICQIDFKATMERLALFIAS